MEKKKEGRKEQLGRLLSDWKEFIEKRSEEVAEFAKKRPGTALAIAFALGLYIGKGLWKR